MPGPVKNLAATPHTGLLACPSKTRFELVEARVRHLVQSFVHMLLYMLFPCMSMSAKSPLQLDKMLDVYYMSLLHQSISAWHAQSLPCLLHDVGAWLHSAVHLQYPMSCHPAVDERTYTPNRSCPLVLVRGVLPADGRRELAKWFALFSDSVRNHFYRLGQLDGSFPMATGGKSS